MGLLGRRSSGRELVSLSCLLILASVIFIAGITASSGCQPFTLAEGFEQIGGIGIVQGRLISTLLALLTLACIYRLGVLILDQRLGYFGVIVAALTAGQLAPLGWTIYSGWLSLLAVLLLVTFASTKRERGMILTI